MPAKRVKTEANKDGSRQFSFRLNDSVMDGMREKAIENGRSLTKEVEYALKQYASDELS